MAAVKQFSFNSGAENWAATLGGASGLTMARDTTAGSDSTNDTNAGDGTLQARRAGKNLTNGTPYWEWGNGTLTWEDLGVPAGTVVSAVDLDYDWRCTEYTTGASTSAHGPAELYDGAGTTLRATFVASATFSGTTSWATRNGTNQTGLSDASNTAIRLRIGAKPNTGNSNSAAVTLRLDWIVVTITYGTPVSSTAGVPAEIQQGVVKALLVPGEAAQKVSAGGDTFFTTALESGDTGYTFGNFSGSPEQIGVQFTPLRSGKVTKVRVSLATVGTPTDAVVVAVHDDSGSNLPGVNSSVVGVVEATSLTAILTTYEFDASSLVSVAAGTPYWLVLKRSGSPNNTHKYALGRGKGDNNPVAKYQAGWSADTSYAGTIATSIYIAVDTEPVEATQKLTLAASSAAAEANQGVTALVIEAVEANKRLAATPEMYDVVDSGNSLTSTSFGSSTTQQLASPFRFTQGGVVTKATLRVSIVNSPTDDAVVEVQTNASGAPSGTVLASGSLSAAGLAGNPDVFTLGSGATVSAGTTYWLVIRRSGSLDGTNLYSARRGDTVTSAPETQMMAYNGSTWAAFGAATPLSMVLVMPMAAEQVIEVMQKLTQSTQVPFESEAAVSGTAVSQTAELVLEWLQGIAAAVGDPLEAAQQLAVSASDPAEANQSLQVVASSDPAEALQGVAAPASDPLEATQTLAVSASDPAEATQTLAVSASDPAEASQGVQAVASSDPAEALQGVAASSSDPFDAVQTLAVSASDPAEANQSLQASASGPLEAAQKLAVTAATAFELLQALAVLVAAPLESESTAGSVSQTAEIPVEVLQGLALVGSADPVEATQGVASLAGVPTELLQAIVGSLVAALEQLQGVAGSVSGPVERLQLLAAVGGSSADSVANVVSSAGAQAEVLMAVISGSPTLEELAPDAILSGTNLTGTVGRIQESPFSSDGLWLTADDPAANTEVYVSFPTPTQPLGSSQTVYALVRRTGAGSPTVRIDIYEGGTLIHTGTPQTVGSATGEVVSETFATSLLSDPSGAGVEAKIVGVAG